MNLVDKFIQEAIDFRLTDKLQIARHIYRRIGQIFTFDPNWLLLNQEEKEQLKDSHIDILNVKDKKINSFSWSKMYVELLKEFDIDATMNYELGRFYNTKLGSYYFSTADSYVRVNIDGNTYKASLTKDFDDLVAVKFGLNTKHNCENNNAPKPLTKQEERIDKLKKMLESLKKNPNFQSSDYLYQVFRCIENSVDLSKIDAGFVEVKTYVEKLLKEFISADYEPYNIFFYDSENERYISTYLLPTKDGNRFFSCEKKLSGLYGFSEIPKERMDFYFQNLDYTISNNLKKNIKNPEEKPEETTKMKAV